MSDRYYARSASDKTDDWPFWFVADKQQGGLNVTNKLLKKFCEAFYEANKGEVLISKKDAAWLADKGNEVCVTNFA